MGCCRASQPASAGPPGPARLLSLAAEALRAVAEQAPVVVVVEDLHWADASTRDLVSYLARVLRRDPVLLLVTVRAEELDPARPVAELVSELARAPHAERLVLRPLDRDEVAAQLRAITGVAAAGRAGGPDGGPGRGQPVLHRGTARGRRAVGDAVPATVREVLLTRVARLPAPGRRVLHAAAVLGRGVPHELLAAVTDPARPGRRAAGGGGASGCWSRPWRRLPVPAPADPGGRVRRRAAGGPPGPACPGGGRGWRQPAQPRR